MKYSLCRASNRRSNDILYQKKLYFIPYLIPKLSASVNASRSSPVHCFEILPTSVERSGESTYKDAGTVQLFTVEII